MGKVILICGKIGSGKTTYADKLSEQLNAVNISQDELMLDLFGAELYENDMEQYQKYCSRVEDYVKRKAGEAAKAGAVVICENGFWPRQERDELRKFYAGMGVECELHYIDTPEEQRLVNIQKRNETVRLGKSDFFLVHDEDIYHYFEVPGEDEIDVRVKYNLILIDSN
ncbi:MAG: ATP-binding protein [Oscillospiraceae bacterium]|nr:ATP-binding protein [Oscillospiraceae bacterium]